jgi:predicted GIY-YIG superfamily endonuclease
MFTVYIIESESTGRWYYGHTDDLADRLSRHNGNRSKATKGRGPWKVVATKTFPSKGEAMAFELVLKRCKRRDLALQRMQGA